MCAAQSAINVELINGKLWKEFGPNNEMVVNKKGRNIFPTLEFEIVGLEPTALYTVSMQMMAVDRYKYRYENGKWFEQSFAETADEARAVMHIDGYKTGQEWMEGGVTFPSLKITNERSCQDPNMIFVQPCQKYSPQFYIWKSASDRQTADLCVSCTFKDTVFIAVTAYKSKTIAELKKTHNKHASGKRKRPGSPIDGIHSKKCHNAHSLPPVEEPFPTSSQLSASAPGPAQQWSVPHCSQPPAYASESATSVPPSTITLNSAPVPSSKSPDCNFSPSDQFSVPSLYPEPPRNSYCNNSLNNLPDVADPLDEFNAANFFIPLS